MGLLVFLAILYIFTFPLGQVVRLSFGYVATTPLDIVVVTGVAIWLGRRLLKRDFHVIPQAKSFFIVIGAFTCSLLVNSWYLPLPVLGIAALYILRWVIYGSIFFMIAESSKRTKQISQNILLIGGAFLVFAGYIQFFLYPQLRNLIYAGWDEHFYRMFGTFFDPNYFGLFLVCYFLLVTTLFFSAQNKVSKGLLGAMGLVVVVAILLSYSRTALVALSAGMVILLWQKISWKKTIFVVLGLGMLALGVFVVVGRKAEGNDLFRKTSTNARIGNAKNAIAIFLDDPLFGVGFNAYRYAQFRHGFMKENTLSEDHGSSGADNSLLLVLATSGIVGFGAFVLFGRQHLLASWGNTLAISTITAFVIGSFFVNGLFYPSLLVWVWGILGLTEKT